jgi:hypothetical protein
MNKLESPNSPVSPTLLFQDKRENYDTNLFSRIAKNWVDFQNPKQLFTRGKGFWSTPNDDNCKSFFEKLTEHKSQREDWYKVTPYIAEFWCALSNIGFFYVGFKHAVPELIFAGTASFLSHSIPKQWLLTVDKIGVLIVAIKFITLYPTIVANPWLLAPAVIAATINLADAYLSRTKGQTWPHVVWHLSAAFLANLVLNNVLKKNNLF